jgi:seryl-tRNA synthetase
MNYGLIQKAINYYADYGYLQIETPWIVSEEASNITKPSDGVNIYVSNTNLGYVHPNLVASGEQSFLQLILDKKLFPGRYQTTTPCFRVEEQYSHITLPYFMKTELIIYQLHNNLTCDLLTMVDICLEFFHSLNIKVYTKEMGKNQIDIIDSKWNIELGSYGIRSYKDIHWVYGTGLALPRTEEAMK